ncbi:CD166 antigen homolog [Sardina pilchardus]|uniref:CD166 antigen homolog n=1 Tax=Sardina pilchardus TaxID=27697 RepID=UPI002E0D49FA
MISLCAQLLGLSAAILSLLRPCGCTGVIQESEIQAEVGGRVRMYCEVDHDYKYLYWQKKTEDKFINGLTNDKALPTSEYMNRSMVDSDGTLELWDLKVSDSMYYICKKITDTITPTLCTYHLIVTARYAQPVLTAHSSGDGLLDVTCSSWGGSPRLDVQWHVHGEPNSTGLWETTQNAVQDPTDLLWNGTSTFKLNCTQRLRISCSIGNVTSEELEICKQLPLFPPAVIIATVVVAVLVLGMLLAGLAQLFKRLCQDSSGQHNAEELPLRTTPSSEEEMSSSSQVEGPREPV